MFETKHPPTTVPMEENNMKGSKTSVRTQKNMKTAFFSDVV
jgi:hypothetical protein